LDVALNPVAAQGYHFSEWGGACSGSGACVVKMNDTQSVTVKFVKDSPTPAVPAMSTFGMGLFMVALLAVAVFVISRRRRGTPLNLP
jgi:hypothetical protein